MFKRGLPWPPRPVETPGWASRSTTCATPAARSRGSLEGETEDEEATQRADPVFFSSRRRHTSDWRDWSSDVCSSDLCPALHHQLPTCRKAAVHAPEIGQVPPLPNESARGFDTAVGHVESLGVVEQAGLGERRLHLRP